MKHTRLFIAPYLLPALLLGCFTSCKKYSTVPDVPSPAYVRIYNDIPFVLDALDKNQPQPFFTFLFDPKVDGNGVPFDAQTTGDFLTTRQLYSVSYPINAGNTFQKTNYDYPGNAPVLTAPSINGFDLSAWAQMPSGKHRIMFVQRPLTDTVFAKLLARDRKAILIDTTVDFIPGEVYTLEALARDVDSAKYSLYVRQESFIHEHFDNDKLYLSVFNLTGAPSRKNLSPYSKGYFATDTTAIYYTYNTFNDLNPTGVEMTIPDYTNVYLTTLTRRLSTASEYYPLPFLPRSYFYDATGQLRTFASQGTVKLAFGTMPFISFNVVNTQGNLLKGNDALNASIYSCGASTWINAVFNQDFISGNGVPAAVTTANLNQFTTINGQLSIYPTINIFEMVYDRVYHIQIQRYNNGH